MRYFNYIIGLMLLLSGGFLSNKAMAYCPSNPKTPYTLNLSNIAVPSDLSVGSEIPGTQQSVTFTGTCNSSYVTSKPVPVAGDLIIGCYYGSGNEVSGFPGVYSTGITGIGISLKNTAGTKIRGTGIRCDTRGTPLDVLDSGKNFNYTVSLVLVKTSSNVGSGTIPQLQTVFGMGVYNKDGIGTSTDNTVAYAGSIYFKTVSCSVPSPLSVDLGTVPTSHFTSIGTTGTSTRLNVPVTCDSAVTVKTTITSSSYALSTSGVVGLTPGVGVATGVGVQMLYNGSPVPFGSSLSVGNVPVANSTLNIPFDFRYYQTVANVTPGDANATVTLTMEYQ